MSFYVPPSFIKNVNSTFPKHSKNNNLVNGQLNNSVGMQKGKSLLTDVRAEVEKAEKLRKKPTRAEHFPEKADAEAVAKQEGGKWGTRDPGTGWSQKQKLDNPEEHKKAVKGGLKTLPAILFAGAASTFAPAALPIIAKATAGAAGILGLKDIVEKPLTDFVNFYSGARKTLKK
jgi:hypothetical protein